MKLRMFGATDKGLVRALNQDAYTCDAQLGLVVLSDGMGGHAAGEIASHMVVEGLSAGLGSLSQYPPEELHARIDENIQKVNTSLIVRSQEDSSCRGMGATVNVLCFAHGFLTIGHVGDSRTYLIKAFKTGDNKPRFGMWQLTVDHNLGTFIDRGIMNAPATLATENELTSRERAKLTRGMGVMTDPKPDIYTRRLEEGDIFLTCSDGLHGFVSDKDIVKTIVNGNIAEVPHRLVELAKAAGAPDNVTVVLSIVSNLEEPLREFTGPQFLSRPYLLRLPNGEIQGLQTSQQVTELWVRHGISGNAEIAAGLGPWILLRNKDLLTKTYTDFKSEEFLKFIYTEPSVVSDHEPLSDPSSEPSDRTNGKKGKPVLKTLLFLVVIFAMLSAFLWYNHGAELQNVLLPAY
ncbi:MAG: serine/threonine-protein phosphatase [Proteobacteria bacterium]|nr:serine/threonine-protein phosphatase [Pseudomonadota bacterium]